MNFDLPKCVDKDFQPKHSPIRIAKPLKLENMYKTNNLERFFLSKKSQ